MFLLVLFVGCKPIEIKKSNQKKSTSQSLSLNASIYSQNYPSYKEDITY